MPVSGVGVRIDMVQSAENDCENLGLRERDIHAIERSLREVPVSAADTAIGEVRTREISGLDVAFVTTRLHDCLVVTILNVQPSAPVNTLAKMLRSIGLTTTIKGLLSLLGLGLK